MKIFLPEHIADTMYSMFTNKGMLLISLGMTPIISAITDFLNIEFLGFSLWVLFFLTALILFDFYTGLKAAKYNNEVITSRKGYRTVDKLVSYFMFICFTAILQTLMVNEGYDIGVVVISNFRILVFILIFLWEFHSIGENLDKRYGSKPRMFTIIDKITVIIEKKVIDNIEGQDEPEKDNVINNVNNGHTDVVHTTEERPNVD